MDVIINFAMDIWRGISFRKKILQGTLILKLDHLSLQNTSNTTLSQKGTLIWDGKRLYYRSVVANVVVRLICTTSSLLNMVSFPFDWIQI